MRFNFKVLSSEAKQVPDLFKSEAIEDKSQSSEGKA